MYRGSLRTVAEKRYQVGAVHVEVNHDRLLEGRLANPGSFIRWEAQGVTLEHGMRVGACYVLWVLAEIEVEDLEQLLLDQP